jgi:septum formation protein
VKVVPWFDCVRIRTVNKSLLVLASTSPRRRELLKLGGWRFETRPADVDESQQPGEAPGAYVLRLAESKARTCAESAQADQIILAADTAVVDGEATRQLPKPLLGESPAILGKPKDKAGAVEMLKALRGRSHQVYTGIAVLRLTDGRLVTDLCITEVPMRDYRDDEIEAYVATGDPLDKAGAYAIQHAGFHPVESMQGCYASVMGLPLCHLSRSLQRLDSAPHCDIAAACLSALGYACPISAAILRGEMVG